jgi:nucleoside-diphosphate-sugar epimerase
MSVLTRAPAVEQITGAPATEAELDERLSRPSQGVVDDLRRVDGDFLVLGAGGKMGLSLARMLRRALDAGGRRETRVTAVSRFGGGVPAGFEEARLEAIAADLLDDGALERLPGCPNVLYLAGMKFGSSGDPASTWALNTLLPGLAARRFRTARIVALSTGNVYGLTPAHHGGAVESDPPNPDGEYAQSCLGRERMFGYAAARYGTPVALIRLNYANDLRYGVVVDVARAVLAGEPVDVTMGLANVVWQGDANAAILRAFTLCSAPPAVLNVSGPETVSVRWLAIRLAELIGRPAPAFTGVEAETALLSNCAKQHGLFGYPDVPLDVLVQWTADWLRQGGRTLGKPTAFQARDGQF